MWARPPDVMSSETTRPSDPATPALSRKKLLLVSIVLAFGSFWILRSGGLPLLPPKGTLDRVEFAPFAAFVFGVLLHMLARHARCHLMLVPLGPIRLRTTLTINAIGLAAITLLPFRLGEFARPAMLRERGRFSALAVAGTVAAERILDGVGYSALLLVSLAFTSPRSPLPDRIGDLPVPAALVPHAARTVALVFALAFVAMVLFYRFRAEARLGIERLLGAISKPLGVRVAEALARVSDGLKFLVDMRRSLPYLVLTCVAILLHVWAIERLATALGIVEVTLLEAGVLLGILSIAFAMPNAPGYFGTIQLALYAGLTMFVSPEKVVREGAAMVFLFYVVYLAIVLLLAALAIVVEYGGSRLRERNSSRRSSPH